MKQKLIEWLADYLTPWFIPRVDYDFVQQRQSEAIRRAIMADEAAGRAVSELHELLANRYVESYRPFEAYGAGAEVEEFRHADIPLTGQVFGWQVKLPDRHFYSLRDPVKELMRVKQYAAEQLTRSFHKHILEKLFGAESLKP